MAVIEILLPKMGESVAEATITKFVVNAGEQTEADEPLVEIATDKVDSEVPAPEDGTLVEWLVQEGDVVAVGQAIAKFEIDGDADAAPASASAAATPAPTPAAPAPAPVAAPAPAVVEALQAPLAASGPLDQLPARIGANGRFYSPLVRSIAQSEGVTPAELDGIAGSGSEGRVTKKDILAYIASRDSAAATAPAAPVAPQASAPAASTAPTVSVSGQDEIVEMDRMRKLIADHMVRSKQTSPHVTSFVEADMTKIVEWRKRNKAAFEQAHGTKLTFTPLIAEAIVKAIRDFPGVNASVDGDRIIIKKQINLGMATALPSGNLIVPVIHNADQLSLVGLATRVNDLADRARTGKLKPDDTAGGTYTMSNVGTFGNVMGTPIINQPQVGILALGAIRKKPAVIETPEGDMIGIRHMMFLSHSYDHRVVDGMLGGSFVKRVATYLEEFDLNRSVV
ncbi:MAG: dihydrolipoamide acetyltransferase family protein [Bacteroidota bacterium]|nr:dihydrolipoamide acetyltransferase family protein [Bacteroidota bacterium]